VTNQTSPSTTISAEKKIEITEKQMMIPRLADPRNDTPAASSRSFTAPSLLAFAK
jgi:hypothetical protein